MPGEFGLKGRFFYVWVTMQAKALAKDATDGGSLRQSAAHLPLVLMSEKGSSTDDVWRGIEVGAADVLEKPLSLLKLRNIWQHVVRKVAYCAAQHTCNSAASISLNVHNIAYLAGSAWMQ